MTPGIRVLLVDDHPIVREGLRSVLERESDIGVVGETADGIRRPGGRPVPVGDQRHRDTELDNETIAAYTALETGDYAVRVTGWLGAENNYLLTVTVAGGGPPPAATLISPTGVIGTGNPTYSWNAVSSSTWYQLYVNDSTGTPITQWYTATEVGCASGTGTCSITPATAVSGNGEWWIQTWNASGNGPWSTSLTFTAP